MRVALFYLATYLVLFVKFPLTGSLPGNLDTLLAIALSNLLREKIMLVLTGNAGITVFFPEPSFIPYGENCFGLGLLYGFFHLFTRDDFWTYYLFLSTLVAGSSWGLYKLASLFTSSRTAPILAGLAYSLAGFTLANIDDANVIFVMLPALSFYFLERGRRDRSARDVMIGASLAGLQIWFGFYVFFLHSFAGLVYVIVNAKDLKAILDWRTLSKSAAAYLLAALPLLVAYVWYATQLKPESIFATYNDQIRDFTSLDFRHFWNVLPNTLLYPDAGNVYSDADVSIPSRLRKSCFPGFAFAGLAMIGAWRSWRQRKWMAIVAVVFLTLSFGTNLPFFSLLTDLPLGDYFRIPMRFYFVTLLVACVLYAIGLEHTIGTIAKRLGRKVALALLFLLALATLTETTPYPLNRFDLSTELVAKKSYVTQFADRTDSNRAVILDLPTNMHRVYPNGTKIDTYNREILYMNWQTEHRQMIAGGVNAYQPRSRIEVDRIATSLPGEEALTKLKEFGIQFLVFHKDFVLAPEEDILSRLKESKLLTVKYEDDSLAVLAY